MSNCRVSITICMQALFNDEFFVLDKGNCAATARTDLRNKPSESFIMLACEWHESFFGHAALRIQTQNLAIRVEARSVMILRLSTTPGTTSCSRPEYKSSVFSLTRIRSTFSKCDLTPGTLFHGTANWRRGRAFCAAPRSRWVRRRRWPCHGALQCNAVPGALIPQPPG